MYNDTHLVNEKVKSYSQIVYEMVKNTIKLHKICFNPIHESQGHYWSHSACYD